jgi:hypothetical protein
MFRAFIQLKNELPDWSCFVVGGGWGSGILTPRKILPNVQSGFKYDLSWKLYNRNRRLILQWISFDEYVKIIKEDK